MRLPDLDEQYQIVRIPFAPLFVQLIRKVDIVQIGAECYYRKIHALFIGIEHALDLRIERVVVYIEFAINLVCRHFRKRKIFIFILSRRFRFEPVI